MKTKAVTKAAVDEDEDEPRKIRSSRSKRRHTRRPSTESESPPRKRSKKSRKRTADKKSKRGKVSSSSRRRRRSPSPSPSLSSSSPSSVSRSCSTCSSSSSEQLVNPPPPRSRSRDVKKRKGRGRDRERNLKKKARRSTSASSTSSSGRSRSRSKSSKRWTKDDTTRDKIEKDYENVADCLDRDEETLVAAEKGRVYEIERYEKNVSLEKIENPPSKNADETEDVLPAAAGGSPVAEEDLELILRQKALENFRKFREAAAMAGKTDNGAARKETLTDSPQNAGAKVTEARSADVTPFRRQASLGGRHPTESPKSEGCGNGTSPWMKNSSAGMSHEAGSTSRILKDGDTGDPTQQEGSITEATHSTSQRRSPQDGRISHSVMQRLVHTTGSASGVNWRLGSSAGVGHVNGAPRIKSVVSIPAREGHDGSATPQRPCENSAPVGSSGEVGYTTPIDISKAEGTNGDDRKTSEPSASNGSILSSADGKRQVTESRIEDKDGSQLEKKTFSRMHDGETVEVSYKVYIPKKTPALARRKLQR